MQSSSKQLKTISSPTLIKLSKSTRRKFVLGAVKMPASKLLMLQQNQIKDTTTIMSTNASANADPAVVAATTTTTTTTAVPYINGQQNGSTKVVLVTSEPIEIDHSRNGKTTTSTNNGTDEELTSLTWLHDKNLLKGNNNNN